MQKHLNEPARLPHHLLGANVRRYSCKAEDAVVEARWVVVVLQSATQQLQQLAVVRLEGFWVGLQHLVEQQETNLFGQTSADVNTS